MGTRILMAAVGTGGNESGLAQIDCPMNGNLMSVTWAATAILNVAEETCRPQLSFGSTFSETNDSRQLISLVAMQAGVLSAVGAVVEYVNLYDACSIPVSMGERIFIHCVATTGVTSIIRAMLEFDFDLDKQATRRR